MTSAHAVAPAGSVAGVVAETGVAAALVESGGELPLGASEVLVSEPCTPGLFGCAGDVDALLLQAASSKPAARPAAGCRQAAARTWMGHGFCLLRLVREAVTSTLGPARR